MARSHQTFNKKEKEKKRKKKREEKLERRKQRKLEKAEAGPKSFEDMISYVDEYGNITDTPPDPSKKLKVKAEDIVLGVPKREYVPEETIRTGKVKFFNEEKGYGFIVDQANKHSIFVHANSLEEAITENDIVKFEIEQGQKGPVAVNVKIAPPEPKPVPKSEAKPDPKSEAKPEPKSEAKPDPKSESPAPEKEETKEG